VSRLRFKPDTFQIHIRSVTTLANFCSISADAYNSFRRERSSVFISVLSTYSSVLRGWVDSEGERSLVVWNTPHGLKGELRSEETRRKAVLQNIERRRHLHEHLNKQHHLKIIPRHFQSSCILGPNVYM
jgi:hypothetical protein